MDHKLGNKFVICWFRNKGSEFCKILFPKNDIKRKSRMHILGQYQYRIIKFRWNTDLQNFDEIIDFEIVIHSKMHDGKCVEYYGKCFLQVGSIRQYFKQWVQLYIFETYLSYPLETLDAFNSFVLPFAMLKAF